MNWMSIVFAAEAAIYLLWLVVFIKWARREWREECQDILNSEFFIFCGGAFICFVCMIVDIGAAYFANFDWTVFSWQGLLVCLGWLTFLGIGFLAYLFVVDLFRQRRIKRSRVGLQTQFEPRHFL